MGVVISRIRSCIGLDDDSQQQGARREVIVMHNRNVNVSAPISTNTEPTSKLISQKSMFSYVKLLKKLQFISTHLLLISCMK